MVVPGFIKKIRDSRRFGLSAMQQVYTKKFFRNLKILEIFFGLEHFLILSKMKSHIPKPPMFQKRCDKFSFFRPKCRQNLSSKNIHHFLSNKFSHRKSNILNQKTASNSVKALKITGFNYLKSNLFLFFFGFDFFSYFKMV